MTYSRTESSRFPDTSERVNKANNWVHASNFGLNQSAKKLPISSPDFSQLDVKNLTLTSMAASYNGNVVVILSCINEGVYIFTVDKSKH